MHAKLFTFVYYMVKVKLCHGKPVHIEVCRKGFWGIGKQRILCHNLVDLLRRLSRAFDNVSIIYFFWKFFSYHVRLFIYISWFPFCYWLSELALYNFQAYEDLIKAFIERNKV